METWIMIILLHGWGAGIGSTGNAVSTVEFKTESRCRQAAQQITKSVMTVARSDNIQVFCVEK